jgi:two-component system response regulator AtoC
MADKTRLLLIDDEDTIRTLLANELAAHGYEVEEAASGQAGLEKIAGARFDLVVLDIRMPEMDGLEVLKNIRAQNVALKVVMLTGVDELKIARDSLQLGANDFMTKPFELKNLIACISRVLKE